MITPEIKQHIVQLQELGLLREDWGPNDKFTELAEEAVRDINEDPQYREKVLSLAGRPEVMLISHLLGDKEKFKNSFIFTCIARRMLELLGADSDELGLFLTTYLDFLHYEGALKINSEPRV